MAAAGRLAELLARNGRIEELQARARRGDLEAGLQLAELLVGQGRVDEAIALLRSHARDDWGPPSSWPTCWRDGTTV